MRETESRSVIDSLMSVPYRARVDQLMWSEVFESNLATSFFALENSARSDSMQCSDINTDMKMIPKDKDTNEYNKRQTSN